ncbi:MAG: BLUF domain-containing protein [Pseudomonadota bacterium]
MDMIQCIYCSKSVDGELTASALDALLEQSRVNNAAIDVTGMLLYESGAFFQVLEGDREVVERLYKRLERDPRHQGVIKLIVEPISERSFGSWSMGYPRVSREELAQIDGMNDFFSQGKSFLELEEGRAKTLLDAFKGGRWH